VNKCLYIIDNEDDQSAINVSGLVHIDELDECKKYK
jgi:hypothetical protein